MTHYTLFIADLHLKATDETKTKLFLDFLNNEARKADALYILGDFFEVWIGDDDSSQFITKIKSALKETSSSGASIYFIPGNRDFFIGSKFAKESGVQLLNDPAIIDLYGTKTMLTHGDLLCSDDWIHIYYRKVVTKKTLNKLFHLLPLPVRRLLARTMCAISKKRKQNQVTTNYDLPFDTVFNTMQQNKITLLIHGHLHRHINQDLVIDNKLCKRICLNEWRDNRDTLVYS